jgi:hypothetical protein
MTDVAAPELFLIAVATLELLADAAATAPHLVIAEDANGSIVQASTRWLSWRDG